MHIDSIVMHDLSIPKVSDKPSKYKQLQEKKLYVGLSVTTVRLHNYIKHARVNHSEGINE